MSAGLHATLIGLAVLWALWPRHKVPVTLVPLEIPATVQLEMTPAGGATPPAATPPPKALQASKPQRTATATVHPSKPTPTATAQAKPPPAPDTQQTASAEPEPPAQANQEAKASPAQPASQPPPSPPSASAGESTLRFNFANAEGEGDSFVSGDFVVPPSPDVRFHNRKPDYPMSAVDRGEQGAVLLLVHVLADGSVGYVDVLRSSGFADLDRAARDAVETWHFLPAIQNGQAVATDMRFRLVFALD